VRITAAVLSLLALLPIPAFADDFFVGDGSYGSGSPRNLRSVVLAADGDLFYVFSRDGMNRVRTDGTIVDREAFGVDGMYDAFSAAIGRGIAVVTFRNYEGFYPEDGYAAALTTEGKVLWNRPVAVRRSSVVYDGRDFLVVYRDSYEKVILNTLDDNGYITRTATLATAEDAIFGDPIAVRTDRGLVAVWRDVNTVRAVPFDASGALGEPVTIGTGYSRSFGNTSGTFAVASNGASVLVVWVNTPSDSKPLPPIVARQLDASGAPVAGAFTIPLGGSATRPAVAWDGTGYRVVWSVRLPFEQRTAIASARVNAEASDAAVEIAAAGSELYSPALAVVGGRIALGWKDYLRGGVRGKIADVEATLTVAPEQFLKTEPYDAVEPAAVWAGDHYVVAWSRLVFSNTIYKALVVRRLDRRGAPLDAEPRVLSQMDYAPSSVTRIASNGAETAVVWAYDSRVFVSRIAADGTSIDSQPLVAATGALNDTVDVASDGRDFLVAWVSGGTANVRRLSARVAFIDETPVAAGERIAAPATAVRLAFDGTKYVLGLVAGRQVWAVSLSRAGAAGDPVLIIDSAGDELVMASSGATTLFISDPTFALTDGNLAHVRNVPGIYLSYPSVVWTGSSFFASDASRTAWVSPSGSFGSAWLPSWGPYDLPGTAVASASDGTALLVYTAPTRTNHAALYARIMTPRRRAGGNAE